ncbi:MULTISPECIES: mechanosensitive ion channel family protein [Mesonia]|uniref:Small-conductance mechanosensitive channel n=1 Tax=Mesonia oceanica TaxID=2687242 RepID=A0AC61YAT4_9FLAO|nr:MULTISPECIES: mechanosensitive ion channel family protein [Mesonia]MBJ97018.1 mechanosensitive ion channel protein MscS [Flavobacteriaceae bacterium]MAN25889.1 mechanosensitive ion channel protein MscS [Mesonia sp.]MAN28137.1 mechanosensitive ion channel protein MscS [Mesonia sp.]MAQ39483.1 mechanosensitive ion channel protein MscS [Mesonia sp.]VVV01632.1 Small-conductance mechanosensitive channel [Mesonia oceanica]|tara:strand:- start:9684 stop:10604 length:921 start_codon:yes stop_codon:yes gene_type:complete
MLLFQPPTTTVVNSIDRYYHEFLEILPRIALGIFVIIAGVLIAQLITNIYKRRILKKANDPLMARFLAQAIKIILILISIMIALEVAGLSRIAAGILTAAGGAAIILGFAFQDIGKNFLAGIILAFNRPFRINDTIKIDTMFGKVKALNFRYTHIKTTDGRDIYIPNSDVLTKPVENYTADGFFRLEFVVGIGYENDIEKAKLLIRQVLANNKNIIQDEAHESFVIEDELAASTINLKVFFWINTIDYRVTSSVLRGLVIKEVKEALAINGFNLPADITELKLYSTEEDIPLKLRKDPRDLLENNK